MAVVRADKAVVAEGIDVVAAEVDQWLLELVPSIWKARECDRRSLNQRSPKMVSQYHLSPAKAYWNFIPMATDSLEVHKAIILASGPTRLFPLP
jgi:hypothetical protein